MFIINSFITKVNTKFVLQTIDDRYLVVNNIET